MFSVLHTRGLKGHSSVLCVHRYRYVYQNSAKFPPVALQSLFFTFGFERRGPAGFRGKPGFSARPLAVARVRLCVLISRYEMQKTIGAQHRTRTTLLILFKMHTSHFFHSDQRTFSLLVQNGRLYKVKQCVYSSRLQSVPPPHPPPPTQTASARLCDTAE